MGAREQLEKEIREAVIFLREHNHTIPSETIEYMKQASLKQLERDNAPRELRIPNEIKFMYPTQFADQDYYRDAMEKLVWEEDD